MQMGVLSIPDYYLIAATLGLIGQSIRGALGFMKLLRERKAWAFSPQFFATTLILGGLSGTLGALVYDLGHLSPSSITPEQLWNDRNFILMAVSAGYFGADVIEGVLGRHAPHVPHSKGM